MSVKSTPRLDPGPSSACPPKVTSSLPCFRFNISYHTLVTHTSLFSLLVPTTYSTSLAIFRGTLKTQHALNRTYDIFSSTCLLVLLLRGCPQPCPPTSTWLELGVAMAKFSFTSVLNLLPSFDNITSHTPLESVHFHHPLSHGLVLIMLFSDLHQRPGQSFKKYVSDISPSCLEPVADSSWLCDKSQVLATVQLLQPLISFGIAVHLHPSSWRPLNKLPLL